MHAQCSGPAHTGGTTGCIDCAPCYLLQKEIVSPASHLADRRTCMFWKEGVDCAGSCPLAAAGCTFVAAAPAAAATLPLPAG